MRRRTGLLLTAAAVVTACVAVACGTATLPPVTGPRHVPAPPPTQPSTPVAKPSTDASPTPPARPSARPVGAAGLFRACPRVAAELADSNLRPVAAIDTSNDTVASHGPLAHGPVRLESGGRLVLGAGRIGAGNGYEAATATVYRTVRVAPTPLVVPVTLAVLDSPESGRRVAFVEVRVRPTPPVRWRVVRDLTIGTDGGDGGFTSGTAARRTDDDVADQYLHAMFPDRDRASDIVCVQRRASDGSVDAVLFMTGWGDGGYPTLEGLDRDGRVVSVVGDYLVLPWRYAGLPGTPAPEPLGQ